MVEMTDQSESPTLDVNYIKSIQYREVACDGVMGGPTPAKKLWLGFYTERLPIPRVVRHQLIASDGDRQFELDPDSPAVLVESRQGVVRNIEFGLYLTEDVARSLYEWLGRNLGGQGGSDK